MLQMGWQREAKVAFDDVAVELGDYDWGQQPRTRHFLPQHQISFSLSPRPGHSQVALDGYAGYSDVGDLVFLPAKIPIRGRSDGGRQRLLICQFGCERLASLQGRGEAEPLWTEAELKAGLDVRERQILGALRRVAEELRSPGFATHLLVESLLTTVLVDLSRVFQRQQQRHSESDQAAGGALRGWQLRRVRERIRDAALKPPSVAELAELCGVSPRHLMRCYKNATGSTLHRAVEEARLERAKQMLLASDLPIKTIAWELGFSHPSSFSIAFQRGLGQTPRAYRMEHRWRRAAQ